MSTADKIVEELKEFARLFSIDFLFVTGGYVRSKVLGDSEDVKDIDIASAYVDQAVRLAGLFASEKLKTTPRYYRRTQTAVIEYNGIKIEFQNSSVSSYMYNEEIVKWMRKNGIDNTPLLNNLYGRDFTINTFILSLKNGEIYDLTHRAADDLKRKIVSTVLPPEITMKYDPIIALRAIRFACKYDFIIAPELRKLIKTSLEPLKKAYSKERLEKEIEKIMQTNVKGGLKQLGKYNLMSLVVPERLKKYVHILEKKQ